MDSPSSATEDGDSEEDQLARTTVVGISSFERQRLDVPHYHCQISCSVSIGSICVARHNGTAAESMTISNAISVAEERTIGSWGETPKTRLFTHCDAAQLPANPMTNPIAPSLAVC